MTSDQADEQAVWRYVLGEASAEETRRIKAALPHNPALRRLVDEVRFHKLAMDAQGSYILNEPVPDRLTALVRAARNRNQ